MSIFSVNDTFAEVRKQERSQVRRTVLFSQQVISHLSRNGMLSVKLDEALNILNLPTKEEQKCIDYRKKCVKVLSSAAHEGRKFSRNVKKNGWFSPTGKLLAAGILQRKMDRLHKKSGKEAALIGRQKVRDQIRSEKKKLRELKRKNKLEEQQKKKILRKKAAKEKKKLRAAERKAEKEQKKKEQMILDKAAEKAL